MHGDAPVAAVQIRIVDVDLKLRPQRGEPFGHSRAVQGQSVAQSTQQWKALVPRQVVGLADGVQAGDGAVNQLRDLDILCANGRA